MILHTHEKGATLIEVLGVLAVVATIATGMFTGIARINQKLKITQAQNQVSDIVKSMRTQFSSFRPSSITPEGLEKVGVYKTGTINEDGKAINVFGTEMTMALDDAGGNPFFTFSYKNIPLSSCFDLLLADWGNDPSSGLKEIKVEGEKTYTFIWKKNAPTETETTLFLLPTSETAVQACAQGKNVNISWSYYL